jgi:hypothetical protein
VEAMGSNAAAPRSEVRPGGAYDRVFYSGMAVAMGITVLAGFAATYYLKLFGDGSLTTISGKPFTPLVHLHGALFTCWVLLFVAQTSLVASGRVRVHRRMGIAGVVLAAAMVVAGVSVAIMSAARGTAPPGIEPLSFLAVPLFDMVLFATFVTAAVVKRRDKESHKRLMLLAYASLLAAPIARMPGVLPLGPFAFFGLAFVFVVAGAIYDRVSRGRIHRVYLWGGALFALSVPARLAISTTGAWKAFATFLTT